MPGRLARTLIRITAGLTLACLTAAAQRPAQPFDAVSFDGRPVSLAALKGKAAVLMFFSTDCPHCQEASSRIDPIYRELRPLGLEIVGLSLNPTDNAGLRRFAERFGASWPIALSSRSEFSRIAGISVMTRIYYPYLLFLDQDGTIREEHQGSEKAWFDRLETNFLAAVQKLLR